MIIPTPKKSPTSSRCWVNHRLVSRLRLNALLLIACAQLNSCAKAQEQNLHFIVGKTELVCDSVPYPVELVQLRSGQLQTVKRFIHPDPTLPRVADEDDEQGHYRYYTETYFPYKFAVYQHFNLAMVYKRNYHRNIFYIIRFGSRLAIDSVVLDIPKDEGPFGLWLAAHNEQPFAFWFSSSRKTAVFRGLNLETLRDTVFPANSITQHIHLEGQQAFLMDFDDSYENFSIKDRLVNGKIEHYIIPYLDSYPPEILKLPRKEQLLQLDPNFENLEGVGMGRTLIWINNPFYLVYPLFKGDEKKLVQTFCIYNRQKNEWHSSPVIKGLSFLGVRAFADWLSGFVSYYGPYGYQQRMERYGEVPGKRNRQHNVLLGQNFDERAKRFSSFPVGVLYLYNMNTQKYIEWDALENGEHQGDSEILLVQDETVYYRINDKIYKAPIINGEKLGESEILVQDEKVPDIHWAFISSN